MKTDTIKMCCVIGVTLLLSCSENPTKPVTDPYVQWKSLNASTYTIDQVHDCYCIHGGDTLRLHVENDSIIRAIRLSDSVDVALDGNYAKATINQLFDFVKDPRIDSIVVTYHPTQGYPEVLDIEPQLHDRDGGVIIKTFNLTTDH